MIYMISIPIAIYHHYLGIVDDIYTLVVTNCLLFKMAHSK